MNRIFLLTIFTLLTLRVSAQVDDITICHTASTQKFAMFASNKNFYAEHPVPPAYVHKSEEGGKMITFKTPDGTDARAYFIAAKKETSNWIFVIQEWWGLNDHIKREAEKLYKDLGNVNILALDMYDGKITANRDEAARYMQQFKPERGHAIVQGAMQYVGSSAKIGTIGWCFGGGQSLLASITAGKQAAACVMYYGMPVEDLDQLKTLNADVLGIFATREKYITRAVVQKFEVNMKAAGKNLVVKNYNADHGFANPSNSIYNEAATLDAYKHTLQFFRARLK